MSSLYIRNLLFGGYKLSKHLNISRHYAKDPMRKTWDVLSRDVPISLGLKNPEFVYPEHADVVIIGGGYIGAAAAYWLKTRAIHGLQIVVLEKDTTYQATQINLSQGTLTQHFSLIENIKLAQFCSEFLRNAKDHLSPNVDIQYTPTGSLILASEKYADRLQENVTLMKEEGQRLHILMPSEIKELYPWINTSDVKLGCMALESEGTFNPWELLKGYLIKSAELGVKYVEAEVIGFETQAQRDVLMEGVTPGTYKRLTKVKYRTADGAERDIKFAACVLAAGAESGNIAKLANIGTGEGMLSVPFPTEKRDFKVYSIEKKASELGLKIPIISDTSGLWLKRDGLQDHLLFGMLPLSSETAANQSDEYQKDLTFTAVTNRLPDCNLSDVQCVNTEIYDMNTFDDTGVLGVHPYYNNLFLASGFGKLGCQHSPAIGRAVSELIIDSRYTTIDFTRFGFDRFLVSEPTVEFNTY